MKLDSILTANSPRKVYLYLGYLCNESCRFCGLDDSREGYNFNIKDIEIAINSLRDAPPDIIEISGGEPTIHPDFFEICEKIKEIGAKELLVFSNGIKFADKKFASRYASMGIENTIIALHAADSTTHDYITKRKSSFSKTVKGLENLSELDVPTSVKFITMKSNIEQATNWVKLVRSCHPSAHLMFNGLAIWGQAKKEVWQLAVQHKYAASFIESAVDSAASDGSSAGIYFMPPCVFDPAYWEFFGIRVFNESVLEPAQGMIGSPLFEECYSHPPTCELCILKPRCVWAWKPYSQHYTLNELAPILPVSG